MTQYMDESYAAADEVIEHLTGLGHDYTAHRDEIARAFEDGIFDGNSDWTTQIDIEGVQELRLIQEDHYDQHMDDDEDKPSWDDMLFLADAYVWFA